jgi:hypothetical protein
MLAAVLLESTADSVDTTVLVLLALVPVDLVLVLVLERVLDADVALVVAFVVLVLEFVACSQVADVAQTAAATLLQQIADAKLLL